MPAVVESGEQGSTRSIWGTPNRNLGQRVFRRVAGVLSSHDINQLTLSACPLVNLLPLLPGTCIRRVALVDQLDQHVARQARVPVLAFQSTQLQVGPAGCRRKLQLVWPLGSWPARV